MAKLVWDVMGDRIYASGVDRGVFYPSVGPGVAWNGLTSIKEAEDANNQSLVYIDGQARISQIELGFFTATLEAYTYPDEFLPYDGYGTPIFSSQPRKTFGLSYRNMLGESAYRIHMVYNCLAKPSSRSNDTLDTSVNLTTFSWDISTTPVPMPYDRPASHLYVDSDKVDPDILQQIEDILYGVDDGQEPGLPSIQDIYDLFEPAAIFKVTDNGDGTATVAGPDGWVDQDISDPTKWTLTSPSVKSVAENTYFVTSY